MLLYIGDMFSLLCFHYFIISCFRPRSVFPITVLQKQICSFHNSNTRQQCPKLEIGTVDVEMSEGPHTNEDDPLSSSLRRSSQKDTRDMTQSITSQAEERACRKKMREDRAHKMPAFGSFQVLKPATLDHSYVPHYKIPKLPN